MTRRRAPSRKDLTPEEFRRFRDYIHRHSGIYLEESKADSLRISLVARATRLGFTDFDEYYRLLVNDESEFNELLNLVTINETSFFRFPAQFEALRDHGHPRDPRRQAARGDQAVPRVVGGLLDRRGALHDRDDAARTRARRRTGVAARCWAPTCRPRRSARRKHGGLPEQGAARTCPTDVVQRYFDPVDGRATGSAERVRDVVDFSYHNLIKEPYPLALMGNWDVIFCRNVTIYFRLESTRRVVQNFFD